MTMSKDVHILTTVDLDAREQKAFDRGVAFGRRQEQIRQRAKSGMPAFLKDEHVCRRTDNLGGVVRETKGNEVLVRWPDGNESWVDEQSLDIVQ